MFYYWILKTCEQKKKEHNFNTSESKAKIVFLLESWLKQYGQEEIARNEIQDMS